MALKTARTLMMSTTITVPALRGAAVGMSYYNQAQTKWCWAACKQMILGGTPTQCSIANTSLRLGLCCSAPASAACNRFLSDAEITRSFGRLGLSVTYHSSALTFAQVELEVIAGRPVEAGLTWTASSYGHVALIIETQIINGVDSVRVYDPDPKVGSALIAYTHLATAYGLGIWDASWDKII